MAEVKGIQKIDIEKLIPYINNAKKHDDSQVTKIASSIREFGFVNPVLIDKDYNIIAGHGRVMAARKLKLTEVPCVFIEGLTETQRKAYILADNRLGELADWDMELVGLELDALDLDGFDTSLTGFDLFGDDEPAEVVEDDVPEQAELRCKLGDLWQLGNHRLICGDSTDVAVIDRLMDGVKADMVFTDPPYGVDYDGGVIHGSKINKEHKRQRLKNDDNDIYSEFIPILNRIIDNGAIYIFYATRNSYEILKPLKENDIEVHSIIAWNKINAGYADMNSHYKNKYEPCVYACRKGYSLNWNGGTTENTVWDIEKDRDNKLHPTQKPIELPTRAIRNSSRKGDIVVDLFGGSGSTLIACEQLNRKCYMAELDPHYCDVIIERWENLTGEKAILISE